jgi:hypothetical protein
MKKNEFFRKISFVRWLHLTHIQSTFVSTAKLELKLHGFILVMVEEFRESHGHVPECNLYDGR